MTRLTEADLDACISWHPSAELAEPPVMPRAEPVVLDWHRRWANRAMLALATAFAIFLSIGGV